MCKYSLEQEILRCWNSQIRQTGAIFCDFGESKTVFFDVFRLLPPEVWGKVIFSEACVILSTGGVPDQVHPPGPGTPPGADPPPEQTPPGPGTPHQD